MSPTVEGIEQKIGRKLVKGDVLVPHRYANSFDKPIEVVDPGVQKDEKPAILVRELTPIGPMSGQTIVDRKHDLWMDVIKVEERTDISRLKLLMAELQNLIKGITKLHPPRNRNFR